MFRRIGFTLASALALCLALSACQRGATPPALPETPTPTAPTARWSDPASWPQGRVPEAGERVTIPAGTALLLDVSPPPLGGVVVDGALVFDQQDLSLTADWVMVHGTLEVGSAQAPFRHRATLTLTGPDEDVMGMGGKFLGAMGGGVIQLYGEAKLSWTRLAATARPGDTALTLQEAPDWQPGDQIVLAATDFDFEQAETFTVTRVEGARVHLDKPVAYLHWGELQRYGALVLDERAEVGLLTRNILVQGDAASEVAGFGGQTMIMTGGRALLHGVAFYRMGQAGRVGRYPVHWHLMGDASRGSYLVNSSVHHSFSRCVTLHGSNHVRVERTVAFETRGHCFFLEDGAEVGNVFRDNLGLSTRAPAPELALLPSDRGFPGPATFWITHPDNTVVGNVAAGSQGTGFWVALPEHPTGLSRREDVWPRFAPLGEFRDNVAHSSGTDGLHVDRGPKADPQQGLEAVYYRPSQRPNDVEGGRNRTETVTAVFERFTAYKNRNRGVWLRGEDHVLKDAVLADNAIGATFASHRSYAVGGLFVGESANVGTPRSWEVDQGRVGAGGRALPMPWRPDFALRGFEFYDGEVGVYGAHFAGFVPTEQRPAAALGYLEFTDFAVHPANHARALTFAPDTQRVHLAARAVPETPDEGEDGYRSSLFTDEDGSVTGRAGTVVALETPLLWDETCERRADWGALLCAGRYAALSLYNADPAPQEIAPLTLARPGAAHMLLGSPRHGPNTHFRSLLPLGAAHRYQFTGPVPAHLRLSLDGLRPTESLRVSLPYPAAAVYIYRDWWIDPRNRLEAASSLEELEASSGDRYYLAGGELHLKLQVRPGEARDWAVLDVCRLELCHP